MPLVLDQILAIMQERKRQMEKDKTKGQELCALRNRARRWGKTRKQTRPAERQATKREGQDQ